MSDLDYLDWAQRHYPGVGFDLGTSGLAPLPAEALGPVRGDDLDARRRFAAAVAARYGRPPEEVGLSVGTSAGLFLGFAAIASHGPGEALIEQPTYDPVMRAARLAGLAVRRFPRRREDGYAIDPDRIEARLTPDTRVVALTDAHNPTGVRAAPGALRELAARLNERGVRLLVDEVYAELAGPTTARVHGDNVITCSSLTKCFGLGWARAGFLFASPADRARIDAVARTTWGDPPPFSAAIGERALERIADLEARRHELQHGKRAVVDAFLAAHPFLSWTPPPAHALFGFVHDDRGGDLRETIEAGRREHDVIVGPGAFFEMPAGFRLGWTLPAPKLAEALARLHRVLLKKLKAALIF